LLFLIVKRLIMCRNTEVSADAAEPTHIFTLYQGKF